MAGVDSPTDETSDGEDLMGVDAKIPGGIYDSQIMDDSEL